MWTSRFKVLWGFVRKYWWALVLGMLGVFYFVIRRLDLLREHKQLNNAGSWTSVVHEEVIRAETDVKLEHAKREAVTEQKEAELQEIERERNQSKRQEKLAEWLQKEL